MRGRGFIKKRSFIKLHTTRGLISGISNAIEIKKKALNAPFSKLLAKTILENKKKILLEVGCFIHCGNLLPLCLVESLFWC